MIPRPVLRSAATVAALLLLCGLLGPIPRATFAQEAGPDPVEVVLVTVEGREISGLLVDIRDGVYLVRADGRTLEVAEADIRTVAEVRDRADRPPPGGIDDVDRALAAGNHLAALDLLHAEFDRRRDAGEDVGMLPARIVDVTRDAMHVWAEDGLWVRAAEELERLNAVLPDAARPAARTLTAALGAAGRERPTDDDLVEGAMAMARAIGSVHESTARDLGARMAEAGIAAFSRADAEAARRWFAAAAEADPSRTEEIRATLMDEERNLLRRLLDRVLVREAVTQVESMQALYGDTSVPETLLERLRVERAIRAADRASSAEAIRILEETAATVDDPDLADRLEEAIRIRRARESGSGSRPPARYENLLEHMPLVRGARWEYQGQGAVQVLTVEKAWAAGGRWIAEVERLTAIGERTRTEELHYVVEDDELRMQDAVRVSILWRDPLPAEADGVIERWERAGSRYSRRVADPITVEVPAGVFEDCLHMTVVSRRELGDGLEPVVITHHEAYAPDVGLVKAWDEGREDNPTWALKKWEVPGR